jgi:hypothetical protein
MVWLSAISTALRRRRLLLDLLDLLLHYDRIGNVR